METRLEAAKLSKNKTKKCQSVARDTLNLVGIGEEPVNHSPHPKIQTWGVPDSGLAHPKMKVGRQQRESKCKNCTVIKSKGNIAEVNKSPGYKSENKNKSGSLLPGMHQT